MGVYNIVSPASLVSGQPEDISVVLSNLQAIQAILNGGIDNANVSPAAALAYSKLNLTGLLKNADWSAAGADALAIAKLAGYPADATKALLGDGTWGSASSRRILYDSGAIGVATGTLDSGVFAIPAGFSHLRVIVKGRLTGATGANQPGFQFNGDTGNNYRVVPLSAGAPYGAATSTINIGGSINWAPSTIPANWNGHIDFTIPFASLAAEHELYGSSIGAYDATPNGGNLNFAGHWASANGITRVVFTAGATTFVAGSRMIVYAEV